VTGASDVVGLRGEQPDDQHPEDRASEQNGKQAVVDASHGANRESRAGRFLTGKFVLVPLVAVELAWLAALVFIVYRVF
jgi:hypothetical protein